MQPSDFILVAARPSMGKTAFVLNVAENVAIKQQITTVVFSLEMSNVQLVNRMLSLESTVDADKIRKGHLDSNDWGKLIEGADSIAKSKLIIDDTPGISIAELRSKCRKYKMENNLGLIIIDYLQLMSGSGSGRSEGRQQEVSDISRALKALARELNVPVVTLSQLSRAVEQRPDQCFRIFESQELSSRMPTLLCSFTEMIITTRIQSKRVLQRLLLPSSVTVLLELLRWHGCRNRQDLQIFQET